MVIRKHVKPRKGLFTPHGVAGLTIDVGISQGKERALSTMRTVKVSWWRTITMLARYHTWRWKASGQVRHDSVSRKRWRKATRPSVQQPLKSTMWWSLRTNKTYWVQLAAVSLRRGRSQIFPSLILRFTNPKWDQFMQHWTNTQFQTQPAVRLSLVITRWGVWSVSWDWEVWRLCVGLKRIISNLEMRVLSLHMRLHRSQYRWAVGESSFMLLCCREMDHTRRFFCPKRFSNSCIVSWTCRMICVVFKNLDTRKFAWREPKEVTMPFQCSSLVRALEGVESNLRHEAMPKSPLAKALINELQAAEVN